VVATLASLSTRSELLRLTPFDTAIVDEASQLVEPPLLRVLMQVRRFVLIGDDRQLPAVVLQPPAQTKLPSDSPLHEIGLTDLRNSYFERLLGCADRLDAPHAITRLCHQGRMHQVVASFPSQQFYGSQLQLSEQPDRRAQQCQALDLPIAPPADPTLAPLATALSQHRLLWLRTLPNHRLLAQLRMHAPERLDDRTPPSHKTNWAEATHIVRVAQLLAAHYRQLGWDDARIADEALGIIASYRNQIAEIRRRLQATEDPALQALAVDTIERYQGSQRRHILASFCVNQPWQLTALCSPHADGQTDRKLNVLLTRAREQLVLVGCAELLCQDPIYLALYQHITQAGAILDARNDLAEV
jgi:DNA replication ATP-dependent helicase Dna2